MLVLPVGQTHKAKLMSAFAYDVVAAAILLNEHLAVGTPLPFLEMTLEVIIARSAFMDFHHTLFTVLLLAVFTGWWIDQ